MRFLYCYLRPTLRRAKLALVVSHERVVGRPDLRPSRALRGDATSNRVLAEPSVRARNCAGHAAGIRSLAVSVEFRCDQLRS